MEKSASLLIYQCDMEQCEAGHQYGPALRDHFLLHLILEGEGVYYIRDQEYHLHKGQGFLITPGVLTTYRASVANPWKYCWIGFHGSDSEEILQQCGLSESQPIVNYTEVEAVQKAMQRIHEDMNRNAGLIEQRAAFYALFSYLEPQKASAGKRLTVAAEVVEYVKRNYSYGITIEQMAHHLGMSRSQMFRQFKKEMGIPPQEYLLKYRLERSKELLLKEKLTITEAMLSAGFSDLSNFSRQFKREYGISPREFQIKGLMK